MGRARRQTSQPTPSPGGNLTLRAGVGMETKTSLQGRGNPRFLFSGMRPQFRGFLRTSGPRAPEPWLAGTGDRKSISSRRSPEMSGPKGRLARKSRGKLLSPFVFPVLPRSPQSFLRRRFQARPFCRLEEAYLFFPEEGVP